MRAIDFEGVSEVFAQAAEAVRPLDGVSLSIRAGGFVALPGGPPAAARPPCCGCWPASSRRPPAPYGLHGVDIAGLPSFRGPVNTVFQTCAPFPQMTVAGNPREGDVGAAGVRPGAPAADHVRGDMKTRR